MPSHSTTERSRSSQDRSLSLYHLLDPEVLADPYPLYHRLQATDPVHWDPYLHAWVVTRYADVVTVLQQCSAARTPGPEQLESMGLGQMSPIARVLVRQMLFLDPPSHTRIRTLAARAFTPQYILTLRDHIQDIVDGFLDTVVGRGHMEVMSDLANPLPATVTAELLGVPAEHHRQLKAWSTDFAEVLGNFQHNPDRSARVLKCVDDLTAYFRQALHQPDRRARMGLIAALASTEVAGDRLSEDEIIANCILTMVGGQETTTNLIGNGLLSLLRHPSQLAALQQDPGLVPSAVEELLRYESPTQHTARVAPTEFEMGGKHVRSRDLLIAVIGAANRDPVRFPDPDRLDIRRPDNRHLAFGWATHFCFGAPLARLEGHIVFETLVRRFPNLRPEPGSMTWRQNLALRGLTALHVAF